jgi:hypothetical protein
VREVPVPSCRGERLRRRHQSIRENGSRGSRPWIAANTRRASSTVRVIGPTLSIVHDSAIAPWRLTRPNVGRSAEVAHTTEGDTIEPRVSVPIAKPTPPAAVAAAEPADEPLDPALGVPRAARALGEPHVPHRQGADTELRDEHGAGLVEACDDGRGFVQTPGPRRA